MPRLASLAVIGATAYLLIATSQAPCRATAETIQVTSRTSCGPETPVTISVDSSCQLTVSDPAAGLPTRGRLELEGTGTLVTRQGYLDGSSDAGVHSHCTLDPNDAGTGFDVTCSTNCTADGGCECSGTLAP